MILLKISQFKSSESSSKVIKLKRQFTSRPDIGGCNLPNKKDFDKAYKKLLKSYKESLPIDFKPKIKSRNTKVSSTVGSDDGCSQCNCITGICGVDCNNNSASFKCNTNCCFKK